MAGGVTGSVFVESFPGNLRLRIDGADPSMPWMAMLSPEAAYALGNELIVKAVEQGGQVAYAANTGSGAAPQRRPPSVQKSRPAPRGGPQSNVDGMAARQPTGPKSPPDDLLGDDFS